jgi:signal transduction histidine kinase
MSLRTARVLRIIEQELLRQASVQGDDATRELALTPRRIISADSACNGWNRLLDMALSNANLNSSDRASAPLDREAVTLARAMRDLPTAWVVTDSDGRIHYSASATNHLLGIRANASAEGQNLLSLLGYDAEKDSIQCNELLGDVRFVIQRRDFTVGDELLKLRIVRSRLTGRSGDGPGFAWILQDITQQTLATEARDQFLMTATHEFRTPLANLQAYAEALVNQDCPDQESQKAFCNTIQSEAKRLARLVDQLLSVGQIEAGSMVINRLQLEILPILEETFEHSRKPAELKEIQLQQHFPAKFPTVMGDRDKLQAVLVNLVGNAIKYTPNGGEVTVSCRNDDQWLYIEVADNGPGIPSEEQERVFEKFFRGSNALDSSEPGNGLGLAFAREVARMHGGDISLESTVGSGSVFTLHLPISGESRSGI